jgi:hypothetical protein
MRYPKKIVRSVGYTGYKKYLPWLKLVPIYAEQINLVAHGQRKNKADGID